MSKSEEKNVTSSLKNWSDLLLGGYSSTNISTLAGNFDNYFDINNSVIYGGGVSVSAKNIENSSSVMEEFLNNIDKIPESEEDIELLVGFLRKRLNKILENPDLVLSNDKEIMDLRICIDKLEHSLISLQSRINSLEVRLNMLESRNVCGPSWGGSSIYPINTTLTSNVDRLGGLDAGDDIG